MSDLIGRRGRLGAALFIAGIAILAVTPAKAQSANCGASVVVAFGESIADIADRCGTTVAEIMAMNPRIPNRYFVLPGMRIQLPLPPPPPPSGNVVRYTVQRGDTLLTIARAYNTTLADIFRLNPDVDAATLRPGDILRLPGRAGPVPPTPTPPAGNTTRYTVRAGDTLRSIARVYNVALSDIYRLNPGIESRTLRAGDVIRLPGRATPPTPPPINTFNYTVRPGDTLYSIARANGVTIAQILALNPNLDASRMRVGDVLRIRGGVVPPPEPTPPPPPAGIDASVSPASGAPGLVVEVSATGFPASRQLKLLAGSKVSTLQEFQQVTTNTRGNATVSVRIPEWAAGPGTLVFAFETLDGRLRAVTDTFRVSTTPPPPPPSANVRVVGTLTREGVECPAMRGDDGKLYTLASRDVGDFRPGDRVRVDGRIADVSICMQGTTIDVTRIGPAPN